MHTRRHGMAMPGEARRARARVIPLFSPPHLPQVARRAYSCHGYTFILGFMEYTCMAYSHMHDRLPYTIKEINKRLWK